MKQLTIYLAILLSLYLAACGGKTETKKTENEQKAPPTTVINSTPANQSNSTVVNTAKVDNNDKDADDMPVNRQVSNSSAANNITSKDKKTDTDDVGKKSDADDKNRNSMNSKAKNKRDDNDDDN